MSDGLKHGMNAGRKKFKVEKTKSGRILNTMKSLIETRDEYQRRLDELGEPTEATEKRHNRLKRKISRVEKVILKKTNQQTTKRKSTIYDRPEERRAGPVVSILVEEYLSKTQQTDIILELDSTSSGAEHLSTENSKLEVPQRKYESSNIETALEASELTELLHQASIEELQEVWDSRFALFSNRQDAARVLAKIRFLRGADAVQRNHEDFLDSDLLEDFPDAESSQYGESEINIPAPVVDDRRKGTVIRTLREGQAAFRQALIEAFGAKCMVTGENLSSVLEAAHIRPYHGSSSNTLENGLILRVDIHRLYDSHQLSIEPQTFKIFITDDLKDSSYSNLSEHILKRRRSSISTSALEDHWSEFKRKQSSV
jgi:hypothetical protein